MRTSTSSLPDPNQIPPQPCSLFLLVLSVFIMICALILSNQLTVYYILTNSAPKPGTTL